MSYQRINYLTSVEVKDETFFIFLDDTYKFVAIHSKEAPELCDGRASVRWGEYITSDSYEGVVNTLNRNSERDVQGIIDRDPEERHWDNVATFNERFAGDDY